MPRHLHLDFETFSKADLKKVGAYRYAFDPSTEILCAAMAINDEEPVVWDQSMTDDDLWELTRHLDALEDPETLIYCHNAAFEMAICQAKLEAQMGVKCPSLDRFRCTLSFARRACLPGKLEQLAEELQITNLKDKKGSSLIKKFSVMQPAKKPSKKNPEGLPPCRIYPKDDKEAFQQFKDYCAQDVRAEQGVAKKLAYFDDPINNSNYTLDAKINARGVPVNLSALRHAQKLIEEESLVVSAKFRQLTGFEITQNARLLEWLTEQGEAFENLQAETIDTYLEPHEAETKVSNVVQALRMKQSLAYASIKKIPTMLACAGPHDNRIRGMLNHHGATTGRWTASLVQFQNMKRPTIDNSEAAYRDICNGISRDMLEITYGPVLEVISSCIRHFVHDVDKTCPDCEGYGDCGACDGDGNVDFPFIDADYAAIEARIVNWLAGQEDALQQYRDGVDRYKLMASVIYSIAIEEVNKFPQRFVGKQATLGCGFQMGAKKFRETCARYGYDLPVGLEEVAINAFRETHDKLVQYWYDIEKAAMKAILHKGKKIEVRNVAFLHADVEGVPFLLLRLPSGRKLSYPRPRISKDRHNKTVAAYYGNIKGTTWGEVTTYGGRWVENITQAVAADIMANGSHKAEAKGYEIATLIHDQALSFFKEGQTVEEFVSLLTDLPEWADGLPIEAEGGLVPFYKKD